MPIPEYPAPAALPFLTPAAAHHRIPLRNGADCPRCGSIRIRPWGGFSGRRRFRCLGCARTFSTFTLTSLRYIKRIDRWCDFLACMDRRMPVRAAAASTGVHKDTAFRWRHRVLAEWRSEDGGLLGGRVALGRMYLAPNEKGSRRLGRPPRRSAFRYPIFLPSERRVWISLAWAAEDAVAAEAFPLGTLGGFRAHPGIVARLGPVSELVGSPSLQPDLAPVLRREGVRFSVPERGLWPDEIWVLERRLTRWLKPFQGVATKYLSHYLQWFRTGCATGTAGLGPGASQQFPRTASEGARDPPSVPSRPGLVAAAVPCDEDLTILRRS